MKKQLELEIINKLFLELSQVATAETEREANWRRCCENLISYETRKEQKAAISEYYRLRSRTPDMLILNEKGRGN